MAAEERWYFTKETLLNTPSRKCGVDPDKELSYRQQAANFIQDMGQRLQVNQLCINTAIVYVHRFYMFHSFTRFHRNAISTCALFLAAKVEEQPRKLEHVIKVAHMCLHREAPPLDSKSEAYLEQSHELISNENIMLQTLGFDVAIDHPHTHVVKCCQLVRGQHHHATASKELAQTSYFMATNSLHLTTMCLQYKPTVVACVCIHLACKWAELQIPISSEGKDWFWYVDKTVTFSLLEELTAEFLVIFDRCPSRLKRKMMSSTGMNDKIQDVAMVEKKLTAEFAAHASGSRGSASSSSTSSTHAKAGEKGEKIRSHNASWPSSMTAKVLGHDDRSSDAEQNGTPATPEVRKERVSIKREITVNCSSASSTLTSKPTAAAAAVANCANSSASTSKSTGSTFTPSSSMMIIQSPQPIVSPIRPSSRQTSSIDLGYCSQSQENSAAATHVPLSPPRVETPKKIKTEVGGRGMTPKEYRERKKRERATADEKAQQQYLVEPPKEPRTRTASSSSESGGSLLSLARHMQPIVALTSLNLTELASKLPTSKHVVSAKHVRQLATSDKQPRSSSSSMGMTATTVDGDHNNSSSSSRHKKVVCVDDNVTTAAIQRVSREDPLPALVRPPILTPSPPLATGEESKPDILEERPMTLSFPSEEMVLCESPQHLSSQTASFPAEPKMEKDDVKVKATRSSSVNLTLMTSTKRSADIKQTIKERLIKHKKSRTQAPTETVIPQVPPETLSVPQASMGGPLAKSDSRISSPSLTATPIARLTQTVADENGASSSVTQERFLPLMANSSTISPSPVERKKQSSVKSSVLLSTVNSSVAPEEVPLLPRASEKPPQLAPIPIAPTLASSVKHERRERHKHKDRDKTKSSREKGKGSSAATVTSAATAAPLQQELSSVNTPAIKLTIPKERLNMTVVDAAKVVAASALGGVIAGHMPNESIGGLKIRIPKRKISGSKSKTTTKTTVSESLAPTAPPPPTFPAIPVVTSAISVPAKDPVVGGGLKIKITKDRLGSMGTYSVGSREDSYKEKRSSEKESRKRERPPSPPLAAARPSAATAPAAHEVNQKTMLLPLPTGVVVQTSAVAGALSTSPTNSKPAKMAKMSSKSGRKSQSPQATLVMSPYDVPPSSNTRSSSSKQDQPARPDNYKPLSGGRGQRGSGKPRGGRGGGVNSGHPPPPLPHPHPRFDASHQVTLNAGPYPYTPYYQFPPNYFNHPMGPMSRHPHGPMHPGDYPPFFRQPPPSFRGLPPPGSMAAASYPPVPQHPDSRVMPPHQIRRHFPPPLPSEPPPAIPPPPPPE